MSLILKGIDLPKEGEQITLAIFHDGDIVSYKYWLPKDSQAIQIPKDHGNLKDIDAIYRAFSKYAENETDEGKMEVYAQLMGLLLHAHTILEAEE